MHFDLRKFIVSGTKPYVAEFQCDLSAKDFAGARIPQPVPAVFDAETDGEEVRMTLRAKTHWCTESAPAASTPSNGKRRSKRSGQQRSEIWMTRISIFHWTKKAIWT